MTDVTPQQPLHPLRAKELRLIPTWSGWKKLWEAEVHPERLIGLLHIGFDVPLDIEESDRILLYLSIADGHTSGIGSWEEERRELCFTSMGRYLTWAKIRQRVAQKAFQELCRHVFKNTESRDQRPSWLGTLMDKSCQALDAVLAFFLLGNTFRPDIHNLPCERSHEYEIAVAFLEDLSMFAWDLHPLVNYGDDLPIAESFRQRRPQFVRVLAGLNKLSLLEKKPPADLDDACRDMLTQIAFSTNLWLPTSPTWQEHLRRPGTLEEAVVGGSAAAKLLLLTTMKCQEEKRFERLRKLTHQKNAAEQGLQKLGSQKSPE